MSTLTMESAPVLDRRTYDKFCTLVYNKAGIVLNDKKEALVQARVGKRMRQLGMADFAGYYRFLEGHEADTEIVHLLDAISTNVTSFFREARHFEVLAELLDRWQAAGQSRFNLWCAASSTGEEPYTIAMVAKDNLPAGAECRILATDISTRVLERARAGRYSSRDVERIPAAQLARHFQRHRTADGIHYQVSEGLQRMVTFGRLNLATPPFPMRGPFDVIFCRNVMIYFDNEVRRRLLEQCGRLLRPGGYLMVGHAESLSGLLSAFRPVEPAIYVRA